MTEFKFLNELVTRGESLLQLYDDPAHRSAHGAELGVDCASTLEQLTQSISRLERIVAKAAVKDVDLRIYSDAMVEKINTLALRHETVITRLTECIQSLRPLVEERITLGFQQRCAAFEDIESQSRQKIVEEEMQEQVGTLQAQYNISHEKAVKSYEQRMQLEAMLAAERAEDLRREVERKIMTDLLAKHEKSGATLCHSMLSLFESFDSSSVPKKFISSLVIVLENMIQYPDAEASHVLRSSNPNYVRDFLHGDDTTTMYGKTQEEMCLVLLGFLPEYRPSTGRCMVLREPSAENEMDQWLLWYEERKTLLATLLALTKGCERGATEITIETLRRALAK